MSLEKAFEALKKSINVVPIDLESEAQQNFEGIPISNNIIGRIVGAKNKEGIYVWPFDKISEISGDFSTGKCVVLDTIIQTAAGQKAAGSAYKSTGEIKIKDNEGVLVVPSNKFHFAKVPTRHIKTADGYCLGGTVDHKVMVYNEGDGKISLKELQKIRAGDWVELRRGIGQVDHEPWSEELLFFILMVFYAEKIEAKYILRIPERLKLATWVKKYLRSQNIEVKHEGVDEFDFLEILSPLPDLINQVMTDPRMLSHLISEYETAEKFLAVVMKNLAIISKNSILIYGRDKVLSKLQTLLLGVGVRSTRASEYLVVTTHYDKCRFVSLTYPGRKEVSGIPTNSLIQPSDPLPIKSDFLKSRLAVPGAEFLPEKITLDCLMRYLPEGPFLKQFSPKGQFFDKVQEISEGVEDVVDFEIPTTHHYITSGFVSHNSTICIETIREAQKLGGAAVFLDFEHAFNTQYAKSLGAEVSPSKLVVVQPDSIEEGEYIIKNFLSEPEILLFCYDSVLAALPKVVLEANPDNEGIQLGAHATATSLFMSRLNKFKEGSKKHYMFTNQLRTKFQRTGHIMRTWEDTGGGKAFKFYADVRLSLKLVDKVTKEMPCPITGESKSVPIKSIIEVNNIKNRLADPFLSGNIVIEYGKGTATESSVMNEALRLGIVAKKGAGFFYFLEDQPQNPMSFHCRGTASLEEKIESAPGLKELILQMIDERKMTKK